MKLLEMSPKLEKVKVFGCHQLSETTLNKEYKNDNSRQVLIQGNEFD
jgi:hypothetical protein